MKNLKRIVITATALVLISAFSLCGCMYFISDAPIESKEYEPEQMSRPEVIEETPTAQSEMQKKFGAYGKEEIGENGEKIFHLFTEEQIAEMLKLREDGIRRSLTYDELLFLINDSIRLYYEYDKIVLPDYEDEIPRYQHASQIILGGRLSKDEVREYAIEPYHGDFSEFEVERDAIQRYEIMTVEMLTVITERIFAYDTSTQTSRAYWGSGIGRIALSDQLLLDGGEISDLEECKQKIKTIIQKIDDLLSKVQSVSDVYFCKIEIDTPIVVVSRFYSDLNVRGASLVYYGNGERSLLFPTEEIEALNPSFVLTSSGSSYIAGKEEDVTLKINRINMTCTLDYPSRNASAILGTVKTDEKRLILTFGTIGSITIERMQNGSGYKLTDSEFEKDWLTFDSDAVFLYFKTEGRSFSPW